jgi:hypothetical protein
MSATIIFSAGWAAGPVFQCIDDIEPATSVGSCGWGDGQVARAGILDYFNNVFEVRSLP